MIYETKYLQYHHHSNLTKYCQDYWGFQVISFFPRKIKETQEIMTGSFSFEITRAELINSIPKILAKFISFRWLKLSLSLFKRLIPMGLCTSKTEFSTVLKYIKSNFLNLETDSRFLILISSLFQFLIQKGEKVLMKFIVMA